MGSCDWQARGVLCCKRLYFIDCKDVCEFLSLWCSSTVCFEDNYTEPVIFFSYRYRAGAAEFARKTHTYRYELVQPVITSSDLRVCGSWHYPFRSKQGSRNTQNSHAHVWNLVSSHLINATMIKNCIYQEPDRNVNHFLRQHRGYSFICYKI